MSHDIASTNEPHNLPSRAFHKKSDKAGNNELESDTISTVRSPDNSGKMPSKGGTSFDTTWAQALHNYKQATGRQLSNEIQLKDLESSESLMILLESRQRHFVNWRAKGARLRASLSMMLTPVVRFSEIAKSGLSFTPFAPAAIIFGATTFLIEAAKGASEKYDWISQLFDKLGDFTIRLQDYGEEEMAEHLQVVMTAILTCLLEIIGLSERAVKEGRFKRYLAAAFLKQDDQVKELFDRLAALFEGEERLVRAISYATGQRTDRRTERIERTTEETSYGVKEISASLNDAQLDDKKKDGDEKLRAALCPQVESKSYAIYGEYASQLLQGSGEWLASEQPYSNWVTGNIPLLWVSGGPGTGKSYLSTMTIERLKRLYPQDASYFNNTSIAYFFIKEDDQEMRILNDILKRIAFQIALVDPVFWKHALRACSIAGSLYTVKDTWKKLFLDFFGSEHDMVNSAFVVIDGVDEATQESLEQLFEILEDLIPDPLSSRKPRLTIAVFGRREITAHMSYKLQRSMPEIEIGHNNVGDITKYIKRHVIDVQIVRQARRIRSEKAAAVLMRDILQRVLGKADGMFFKVVLIMKEIRDKESKPKVFEAIQEAPPMLNTMIQRIFERLAQDPNVNKDYLKEILLWVAFSKRPVNMGELYVICELRTGVANEVLEDRLRKKCASIFKLTGPPQPEEPEMVADEAWDSDAEVDDDEQKGSLDSGFSLSVGEDVVTVEFEAEDRMNSETVARFRKTSVQFAHASIRDFLVKSEMPLLERIGVNINPSTAELHILLMCLDILTKDDVLAENQSSTEILTIEDYAVEFFLDHFLALDYASLGQTDFQALIKALYNLFHDSARVGQVLRRVETMKLCRKFVDLMFWNNKVFSKMGQIPSSIIEQCFLEPEERSWFQNAIRSPDELFRPLRKATFVLWFRTPEPLCSWNKIQLIISILHCCCLIKDIEEPSVDEYTLAFQGLSTKISEKRFTELAELSGFEHNTKWHTRIAEALLIAGHVAGAVMHTTKALDMKKDYWPAKTILVRCYEANEEFGKAIEWQRSALEDLSSSKPSPTTRMNMYLPRGRLALARFLVAIEFYDEATHLTTMVYNQHPQDGPAMKQLLDALMASESFSVMLDLAKDLHSQEGTMPDMTRFEEYLISHSLNFGPMSKITNAAEWFVPLIENLGTKCWERQEYLGFLNIALLKYMYFTTVPNSGQDFQLALRARLPDDVSKVSDFKYLRRCAARYLCQMYLDSAISAQEANQDPTQWISKLQDLSTQNGGGLKGQVLSGDTIPPMIYGHWLHKFAKADPSVWIPCFRFSVNYALDLLEDDVPSNDQTAFGHLGVFLLVAGDVFNAKAALAVTMKGLEMVRVDPSRVAELKKADNLRIWWTCDGLCRTRKSQYKELHFCEDCWDTCFCENCIILVREGRLPFRQCSPKHSFVQMYPVSEEMRDVAATFTESDTKLEMRKDWLDGMRKKWKADESDLPKRRS